MIPRCLGHRAPLLWVVLPLAGGLVAGHLGVGPAHPGLWLGLSLGLLAGAIVVLVLWRDGTAGWASLFVPALFFAGLASHPLHRARLSDWDNLPPREARLLLRIERTYPQKEPGRTSGLARVAHADRHLQDLVGQPLYFSLRLARTDPPLQPGALVRGIGLLARTPARAAGSGFESYLCAQGINFRWQRGRVLAQEAPPSDYRQFCIRAAGQFHAILGRGLAEKRPELAGILRAMLLGQIDELSPAQNTWFMRSGTMHLFAISGLHITSMALALRLVLTLLRIPAWARIPATLALVWLYVDITGASPSAVRAFVMVALVECGRLFRQPGNSLAALSVATLGVLIFSPLQLFQAGFQMSYAIVALLLLAGLPLSDWAEKRWRPFALRPKPLWRWWHHLIDATWHWLCGAGAIGCATLGISLFFGIQYFRLFTPGSLLANLILIPLSDLVLYAGLASLVCGLLGLPGLPQLCNHAAGVLLWGMEKCVQILLALPGTACPARFRWEWLGNSAIAALLAACLAGYAWRWAPRRVGGWIPALIVVLVLVAGVRYG